MNAIDHSLSLSLSLSLDLASLKSSPLLLGKQSTRLYLYSSGQLANPNYFLTSDLFLQLISSPLADDDTLSTSGRLSFSVS